MTYIDKEYYISLKSAADEGDGNAAMKLQESFEAVKNAAETGDVMAQGKLGLHYYYGFAAEEDKEKAFYWFEKAAFAGDADSMHHLAWCYKRGDGTKKCIKKFYKWEKKAAFAFYENGKIEDSLHCIRCLNDKPCDKEIRSLLFKMRCRDETKEIMSNNKSKTKKYLGDFKKWIEKKKTKTAADASLSNDPAAVSSPDFAPDSELNKKGPEQSNVSWAAGWGWVSFKDGELSRALSCFNKVLEAENKNAVYFHCRSKIHKALGIDYAADYDLFRAKLIDLNHDAKKAVLTKEIESELGLANRKPLIEEITVYDIIHNEEGGMFVVISSRDRENRMAELFYSGGNNALLRCRMDQYIFLDYIDPTAQELLKKIDKVIVAEYSSLEEEGIIEDVYEVSVRHIPEGNYSSSGLNESFKNNSLDSIDEIFEDGYPLFASLASLVRQQIQKGKCIGEVIFKDDLPNLAAVLAMEEDYGLLEKYIAENLPLNERLGWWFKEKQPTLLCYITSPKVWFSLKDPVKMLKFLVEKGADPNMTNIEGETPLGIQCLVSGAPEIMKALLDVGADPNLETRTEEGLVLKPLHILLSPDEYDENTDVFTPLVESEIVRARMLIEAGADVNAEYEGITPMFLAITYSAGAERVELVKLLCDKGAI